MSPRLRLGLLAAAMLAGLGSGRDALADPAADASGPAERHAAPRIVSLAPHLTELAFEAGAAQHLVGVVEWSDEPAAARSLPRIGDAFRFDPERILALDATHVLAWQGGTPEAAMAQLEALGLTVVRIESRTLDQIGRALKQIAQLAGESRSIDEAASRFRQRLEALRRAAAADGEPDVAVFYQVSRRPLFTLGGRHVVNEVLALCGAHNVFGDLDTEAATVSAEAVIEAAPALILVGVEQDRQATLADWSTYPALEAARCGHVRAVDADLLVRPGPRILDGVEELCDIVEAVRSDDCRNGVGGSGPEGRN